MKDFVPNLVDALLERDVGQDEDICFLEQANNQVDIAKSAFEKVIEIQPEYLPDERLLIRQAEVLLEQKLMKQYVKCMMTAGLVRSRRNKINISRKLKKIVFEANKDLQRDWNGIELHDYALRVTELLHADQRYPEMLHVVAYAFLNQKFSRTGLPTFQNLLPYASVRAENYSLAFEYLRFSYVYLMNGTIGSGEEQAQQLLFCRIFNGMNFVFCRHQSVGYHRFVMRALAKTPENYPLHIISGNNSLVTGSYRHALGEYFRVWLNNRDDPLVCLLIALTFTHMTCKKDISSRHMIAMRGIAFMKQYQRIRGCCQEVNYNIGRMLQQLGVLSGAIYFYDRVLHHSEVPMVYKEDEQTGKSYLEAAERYDLKRLAAHNLALIYVLSGNRMLARKVLEEFCVV
uniref:Uncharacterized protein n=1 Tax=Ditylenchus dipsaci TaxID=166011 RepID=A0A915DBY4_9BILA